MTWRMKVVICSIMTALILLVWEVLPVYLPLEAPAERVVVTPVPRPTAPLPPGAGKGEEYCLALALYHEARGEIELGKRAVAAVIFNRVADPRFPRLSSPNTVCGVVYDCANPLRCDFAWYGDGKPDTPYEGHAWAESVRLAGQYLREAREGTFADPTGGALYFHSGARWQFLSWELRYAFLVTIGGHHFYAG